MEGLRFLEWSLGWLFRTSRVQGLAVTVQGPHAPLTTKGSQPNCHVATIVGEQDIPALHGGRVGGGGGEKV